MGRIPNIKINSEKLDADIKSCEGAKFDAKKISAFIMGRNADYYSVCIRSKMIAEDVLDRVCEYYELDKNNYKVTEAKEKEEIQQKADTQNYENLILLLTGIDKSLKELIAAEKGTQFILNEIKSDLMKSNTNSKNITEKLETIAKATAYRHTMSKGGR